MVLAGAYAALATWVPQVMASYAQRQLSKGTGATVHVSLKAAPFWKLFSGRFDRLDVTLEGVDYKGAKLKRIHILWDDGHLDVGQLEVGVVRVDRVGMLRMEVALGADEISQMIPKTFRPFHPKLAITPDGLTLRGDAPILGLELPMSLTGRLVPSADGKALFFRPSTFRADGQPLPLPPETKVYALSTLPLPQGVHLHLRTVHLRSGTAVFILTGS